MSTSPEYSDALVSKVTTTFGEKGPEVLNILKDAGGEISVAVGKEVSDVLAKSGLKVRRAPAGRKIDQKVRHMKRIMDNNGLDPVDGKRWTMDDFVDVDKEAVKLANEGKLTEEEYKDTQYSTDQPLLFPRVVAQQVREAIEPELNITPLMQTIRFTNGPVITFPAVSSMMAGNLKIAENGEYPEGRLEFAGQVTATIGKHGIKVSMSDEIRRYSMWDVWNMNLRAASRALARHKENQAVDQVLAEGTVFIDNTTQGARHTTGRDSSGSYNGTFTVWDLYDMCADLVQDGYQANTILMHPFAWPIFALDPVMRTMALWSGKSPLGTGFQGRPGNGAPWDLGGLNQQRNLTEPANQATTFAPVPSAFPFGAMQIVVSPYIDYDRTKHTTSIYVCDVRDLGILVIDEEVVTEEWRHPEHDITSVKFRERYTFATANLGRAIRIAKGCVVARAYHFEGSQLMATTNLATSEFTVS